MSWFSRRVVTHGATATATAILVAAAAFIAPWEGYFGRTYKDSVGVKTVCYGVTAGDAQILGFDPVKEGQSRTFSKDECQAMLAKLLVTYDDGMMKCIKKPITANMHEAFLSTTYNIGIDGFCKSSMARRANAGDAKGACEALLLYNRGGGRVIKGLDNRRHAERALCLKGL